MREVFVRAHNRRHTQPVSDRALQVAPWHELSANDKMRIENAIIEIRSGKRSGYTYTSFFKFDVDDPKTMGRTYDKLGPRVMYVIASTNREYEQLDLDDVVIGPTRGLGFWRSDDGALYADDIRLWFNIDEVQAMEIAREARQQSFLKVDGRTRSYSFVDVRTPEGFLDMREQNRRYFERVEKYGFVFCPKCRTGHTGKTLKCRGCGYSEQREEPSR